MEVYSIVFNFSDKSYDCSSDVLGCFDNREMAIKELDRQVKKLMIPGSWEFNAMRDLNKNGNASRYVLESDKTSWCLYDKYNFNDCHSELSILKTHLQSNKKKSSTK